jgi:PhnB protein
MKNETTDSTAVFAPHLQIKNVLKAMNFYETAFGAVELRRWTNPDGSVHVAEMSLGGALFHLHEEVGNKRQLSPETVNAVTSLIGVFVNDPDLLVRNAVDIGGKVLNPMQDYDYGYRQGTVIDPFGHQWLFQKRI